MKKFEQILWLAIFLLILLTLGRVFIRLFPYLLIVGLIAYFFFSYKKKLSSRPDIKKENKPPSFEKNAEFGIEDAEFEVEDEEDEPKK